MKGTKKIKIRTPEGKIIRRIPKIERLGNFAHLVIRYDNDEYMLGDGTEYLRGGFKEIWDLEEDGRKIER